MSNYIDAILQSSSGTTSTATTKKDTTTLGKEDFLSLLVAQMKNQDPLNPDDPTQFTAQLAQFSQLEQLFNLNGSMENLVSAYQGSERLTALGTIGKEVSFSSNTFNFDGGTATLGYQLDEAASKVSIALQKNGSTVAILQGEDLGKGTHYITWDGLRMNGTAADTGEYSILIDAKNLQGETMNSSPLIRTLVTGADLGSGSGGKLMTSSGDISFANILGVFEAESKIGNQTL